MPQGKHAAPNGRDRRANWQQPETRQPETRQGPQARQQPQAWHEPETWQQPQARHRLQTLQEPESWQEPETWQGPQAWQPFQGPQTRRGPQAGGPPTRGPRDRRGAARISPPPRRRRKTALFGGLALVGAFSLLVTLDATHTTANHGSPAAFSSRNCISTRLTADVSETPLGANVSGVSGLDAATAQFGHMPVIRAYYKSVPGASQWKTGVLGLNRSAVVVSFRPPPSQILSGADDTALAQFFDAAPTGHPIYYSYYHEPEAPIKDGQFTFAQYKDAWAHIVAIADKAHNPDLRATLILQHQDADPGDQYNFRNYLPSGGIISVLGWDAYPNGTDDDHPQPTPPTQFMGPAIAASRSVGLPFGFAEFALGTQTDRPQWLTQVASYIQSSGALFGTLFDASGFPLTVLHDSASIQAWRSAITRSAEGLPVVSAPGAPGPSPSGSGSPSSTSPPAKATPNPTPTRLRPRRNPEARRGSNRKAECRSM